MNYAKHLTFLSVILFASACGTTHYIDTETPISEKQAVINLREDALILSDQGSFDKAKATLERALRIEPSNAVLWFDLAQLNAQTENLLSAKNLALRAINLSDNASLKAKIKKFINAL